MKNTMQKVMWAIAAAIFCILVVHTPGTGDDDRRSGRWEEYLPDSEWRVCRDDDDRWKTGNHLPMISRD